MRRSRGSCCQLCGTSRRSTWPSQSTQLEHWGCLQANQCRRLLHPLPECLRSTSSSRLSRRSLRSCALAPALFNSHLACCLSFKTMTPTYRIVCARINAHTRVYCVSLAQILEAAKEAESEQTTLQTLPTPNTQEARQTAAVRSTSAQQVQPRATQLGLIYM